MDSDTSFTKEARAAERRPSHMSIEAPLSPVSTCSDSISIASRPSRHSRHSQDFAENALQPHLSRTSSTNAVGGIVPTRTWTQGTAGTAGTQDMAFEVDFDEDTRENPQDWSLWYKGIVIAIFSFATTSTVLYSTSYTSAIPGMVREWSLSETEGILGVTTYLLGMATGSVVLAPLSEMYGRRIVYLITMSLFVILVIPCAVAKNIATILVIRFFVAFCAAAMISNAPGTVNDIVDEDHRALAFSVWSIGPMNGPVIGPVVGGFVYEYLGWRWTNWVVVIVSGVACILVALVPETYAPALLRRKAHKKRKEIGDNTWWSRYDDSEKFWPLLKVNLSRPFVLTVKEPICMFWDVYIALVYGVLYLCFVAYPIVFRDLRGWSPGFTGLSFCGIGIGGMVTIVSEPLIRRMINAHKHDPETDRPYPEAMVSVVCIASILIPAGQIIFSWTCTPNVHWIVPILAGIPFGAGNAGVFIYASNYLVQSYGIYAASALAGNAVLRSVMGATLPLAGPSLYRTLGANWAGMLLGLLEALFIPIPFIFYRYGHKIREKSSLIRQMAEDQRRREARQKRAVEKSTRRAEAEVAVGGAMSTGAALDEKIDIEKDIESAKIHEV
ncbi:Major facilitator superfamily multidrug transporter mdrA [Pseudocercospora fuligena]|uniref:Cercosporin MFS transporter CTB4 n=1 Tax=Pseudocercospora fuligena TaxID=685502 RepID=A0A8H6RVJ4_9PEZI|nr:Major facilitator superfamily multidrug transporter mdrA [Pseudocercospora fuligena]